MRAGLLEITLREGASARCGGCARRSATAVVELERIAFGPLRLGDLGDGRHRRLTAAEVERLRGRPGAL